MIDFNVTMAAADLSPRLTATPARDDGRRQICLHMPNVWLYATRDELIHFAEQLLDVAVEFGKFDAAEPSPTRLVSPVSAAGSPASSAPGLVATSADGGTGGAPGTPADCVPVPAPNISNNPKEGE